MSIVNFTRLRNRVLYPIAGVILAVALYIAWFKSIYFYGQPITLVVVLALVVLGLSVANYQPKR